MVDLTPILLKAADVAKRLNTSTTMVYDLCDSGELDCYRLGTGKRKQIRVSEEQLEAYLAAVRQNCPPVLPIRPRPGPAQGQVQSVGFVRLRAAGWKG